MGDADEFYHLWKPGAGDGFGRSGGTEPILPGSDHGADGNGLGSEWEFFDGQPGDGSGAWAEQ